MVLRGRWIPRFEIPPTGPAHGRTLTGRRKRHCTGGKKEKHHGLKGYSKGSPFSQVEKRKTIRQKVCFPGGGFPKKKLSNNNGGEKGGNKKEGEAAEIPGSKKGTTKNWTVKVQKKKKTKGHLKARVKNLLKKGGRNGRGNFQKFSATTASVQKRSV